MAEPRLRVARGRAHRDLTGGASRRVRVSKEESENFVFSGRKKWTGGARVGEKKEQQ